MSRNWLRITPRRPADLPHLKRIGERDANPCQYEFIVAKPDSELTILDLENVLCYGTSQELFDEVVYYVPLAFERIINAPEDGFELVSPLIEFGADAVKLLRDRGWWLAYRLEIWNCFVELTKIHITIDDTLLSFDDVDMKAGWHVNILSSLVLEADKYEVLRDMGEAMAIHLVVVSPDLLWPRVSLALSAFLNDFSSAMIVELISQTLPHFHNLEQHYREKAWRQRE